MLQPLCLDWATNKKVTGTLTSRLACTRALLLESRTMSRKDFPTSVLEALTSKVVVVEDIDAARQWLASEDVGECALAWVLGVAAIHAAAHAVQGDRRAYDAKLRFVQLALARGADPNRLFERNDLATAGEFHQGSLVSQIALIAGPPSLIDLLQMWGAHIGRRASKITKTLENGGKEIYRYSALAYTIRYCSKFRRRLRAVAYALLRCGASLDSAVRFTVVDAQGAQLETRSESIEWVLGERERREPSLASDAHYLAFKAFLLSVRAAGGYRSFVIEQSRTCALMRHLAIRGRATTHDGPLGFLARTGERGLFRRVLSYISLPPLRRPFIPFNITVRGYGDDVWEIYFKIHTITRLFKLFKAFATRRGVPVARLVFSLPASPDVLIEGCQTSDDLGLAEGSVIDATLCDEHPARIREKAAAAAAVAAAAARRYLEDLEARRVAGAEVEETAARAAAA